MGIIQPPEVLAGQVDIIGAIKYMTTTDNLAAITAAGYLNNLDLSVFPIAASDILGITYSYNIQTHSGTFGFFTVSIANGVITLSQAVSGGNVLLPVTNGHVPVFNGTTGQIKDSGAAMSNTSDTFFVMSPGSVTSGNFPEFSDTHGTLGAGLPPSAASQAFVVVSPGSLTSGNFPQLNDANGTINTGLPPSAASQAFVVVSPGSLTTGHFPQLNDANGTINNGLPPSAASQSFVATSPGGFTIGNLLKTSDANGTLADSGISAINAGFVQQISVQMNDAQVTGMFATPFNIVPAPGIGKVVIPISAQFYLSSTGHTAFANGGVGILQWGNTADGAGTNSLTATIPAADITAASSQIYGLAGVTATALTSISNLGLYMSNQTGAFTAGTGSTFTVVVQYFIFSATV